MTEQARELLDDLDELKARLDLLNVELQRERPTLRVDDHLEFARQRIVWMQTRRAGDTRS